jgi:signal transduction histidine kinase
MSRKRTNEDASGLRARIAELEAERATLEEQVRSLNRAKTTMDLLAGVAHDLAAALTGVVWCSQALCRRLEAHDPELSEGVADFVGAADFARQLARRLILISRQPDVATDEYELHLVFGEAVDLLETLRPPKARLHATYAADALWVHGNADQLQQIVINLVANAFDALQDREGTVEVALAASAAPDPRAAEEVAAQGWALLRVSDNGSGMDVATLERAFEPFFTTKEAQAGSGLGLAVVKRVVERHGGMVRAVSSVGGGTTIDVYLPTIAAQRSDSDV